MSIIGWFAAVVAAVCAAALAMSAAAVARTHAQAQAAADAAALAAVTAAPFVGGDGDSCASARRAAQANGARLIACDAERGAWALHADVSVDLRAPGPAAALPGLVAHAAAELVPLPTTARPGRGTRDPYLRALTGSRQLVERATCGSWRSTFSALGNSGASWQDPAGDHQTR